MEIDQTTYDDLSLISDGNEFSVFQKMDLTRTHIGREHLRRLFMNPFSDLQRIRETQQILSLIASRQKAWPMVITNGTIMVMEKFYETVLDRIPDGSLIGALAYKLLHAPSFSLLRYSVRHFADFVADFYGLIELFDDPGTPLAMRSRLERARRLLEMGPVSSLAKPLGKKGLSITETVKIGAYLRDRFRDTAKELIEIYGRLDAWFSMSMATEHLELNFPEFIEQEKPVLETESLRHILLEKPIAYPVKLNEKVNFLFLTGANMAGKSTFIRAVGCGVFLAHLGMGVPAKSMRLTPFDGILSNINVEDNISKGESLFFNEVQRIKHTLVKINKEQRWLVLIDELFKGTNVEDAMKCSITVIKGLIKIRRSLFVLSTHLYEIAEELRSFDNIGFKYFETSVVDDQFDFSYQIRDGISNDRVGYLILKREKVVQMLEEL